MKRQLDQYDIEAEREALAIRNSMNINKPVGKKVGQVSRMRKAAERRLTVRAEKRAVVIESWTFVRGLNNAT